MELVQSNPAINQPILKAIAESSDTAMSTMLALALRERDARGRVLNISAMKRLLLANGEKIVDEDYEKFWDNLQKQGIGQVIIGRRGNPDKFKLNMSIHSFAVPAIDEKAVLAKAPKAKRQYNIRKPLKKSGLKRKRLPRGSSAKVKEIMQAVRSVLMK